MVYSYLVREMPNNKRVWERSFTVFSERDRIHSRLHRAENEKRKISRQLAMEKCLGMVRAISHRFCHCHKTALETNDWDDISVVFQLLLFIPMPRKRDVIQNSKWQIPNV